VADQAVVGPRLAASTGCTYLFDVVTEESVELLHAAGLREVEIYLQCDDELDGQYLRDLAARCAGLGLTVISLHPYVFGFENLLFTRYRRQRQWATRRFERYLNAAQVLGATAYVSHGPPRHLVTHDSRFDPEYVRTTRQLLDLAAGHGVRYCLENVSYGLLRSPEDADRHLAEFGEALSLVIDFKSAWKSGFCPADFLHSRLSSVSHLQVSYRAGGRYGLGADAGDVDDRDLADAFRLCLDEPRTVPAVLEIEAWSESELTRTIQATRDLLDRIVHASDLSAAGGRPARSPEFGLRRAGGCGPPGSGVAAG
jgi:sugar phosphate isomerase/epimerase